MILLTVLVGALAFGAEAVVKSEMGEFAVRAIYFGALLLAIYHTVL